MPAQGQPGQPQQVDPAAMLKAWMAQQANTTGMTQTAPSVPNLQARQPQPFTPQQQHPAQAYGPGQGGARQRASMQNFATSISNAAGKLAEVHKQRVARDQQATFDRFSGAYKGLSDAQGQQQQAQQEMQQAKTEVMAAQQSADPDQIKSATAKLQQASQRYQQAQTALKQNQTILNDLANDSKKAKLIAKGYGIDDKNADTPERKQAIESLKKQMGVGDKAAGMISQMPSTMQLSPEAERQRMMQQSGVTGKPATEGQRLAAQEKVISMVNQNYNKAIKMGMDEQKIYLTAEKQGLMPERDENGAVKKQPDGTVNFRPMTQDERGVYQLGQKGVLAWTIGANGRPTAVMRNPVTNQVIPGTENPDLLPPAYLTERLRQGEFTFTNDKGEVFRVPTVTKTTPILPGAHGAAPGSTAPARPAGGGAASTVKPAGSAAPAVGMPKGSRPIGQGQQTSDPVTMGKSLADGVMAPSQLPARGTQRQAAIKEAQKIDPKYSAAQADIDFKQAENPGVQSTLKYLDSLTGRDNKSGNLGEVIRVSDSIKRTDFPAINNIAAWSRLEAGNPDIAVYRGVVTEVADQVAKIMQGGGGGATSDAKMKQAVELLATSFSKDQMKAVAVELRKLLANRKESLIGDNRFLKHQFAAPSAQSGGVIVVSPEDMK